MPDSFVPLSGIGQSKAEAIVAYREEHGDFASIEEIMNVEGIKEGTFSKDKRQDINWIREILNEQESFGSR